MRKRSSDMRDRVHHKRGELILVLALTRPVYQSQRGLLAKGLPPPLVPASTMPRPVMEVMFRVDRDSTEFKVS